MSETVRPTVLLHGFTGSSRSWGDPVVHGLRSRRVDPILVDLPGHGARVDPGEGGVGLDDVTAVVDQATADLSEYDLVGYSMGGRLALHVALARQGRIRRLVLESASPGLAREAERAERRAADAELASRIERDGVESFVDAWSAMPLFASQRTLPRETRERVRRLRLANRPSALAAVLRTLGTGVLPSLWDRLRELTIPVLLVTGALDTKFVRIAREMSNRLPDAWSVNVPGVGHTVHLEAPHAWLDAVTPFLHGEPPPP